MRTVNVRLLGALLAGVVIFGVLVHFLHGYQVRRNAYVFCNEARKAREAGDISTALLNYRWYVNLAPNDQEVLEEFGYLLADKAQDGRTYLAAYNILERLLRLDPERMQARRKLVDVALAIGRYSDARIHLESYLLSRSPNDPELMELLGECLFKMGENTRSVEVLQQVIKKAPERIESYRLLAAVYRERLDRPKDADKCMEQLVLANPKSAKAHFARGTYLRAIRAYDEAQKHALRSLELAPDDRDTLLLAAQCYMSKEQYEEARGYALRGLKLYPGDAQLYIALADVELRTGHREKAIVRLQDGLKATQQKPQLLWILANLFIEAGQHSRAEKTIEQLREAQYPAVRVSYLKARIEYEQGHWLAARQGLEATRSGLADFPDLLKQADFWIGRCYGEMGNTDQQIAAYRRALDVDPFFGAARGSLAEVLLSSGRVDEALEEFQQAMRLGKMPGGGWLILARMLLLRNFRRPLEQRNWLEVEQALDRAARTMTDAVQIPILRAEVLVAQNRVAEAEKLLETARDSNQDRFELWSVLASLAQREEAWDKAQQILDQAAKQFGDTVPMRLARAQYLVRRYRGEAAKALRELTEKTDAFSPAQKLQLWNGLLPATMQVGDEDLTLQLCQQIVEKEPNSFQVRFLMCELALRRRDLALMEQSLREVEKTSGRDAAWMYGEAARLTLVCKEPQDPGLEQALSLLNHARELRPTWGRVPLLAAAICDRQGRHERALEYYRAAVNLGERTPQVVRRIVQLLYQRQRYHEADRLLRDLERRNMPFSTELDRYWLEIVLRQGDFDRALQMAKKSATVDANNYREQLWLGQVLGILGRRAKTEGRAAEAGQMLAEAEKALRRAVEINGKIAETWVALIHFLSNTEQITAGEKALLEAQQQIPADQAALALGECYEALGQADRAREKYQEALGGAPDDSSTVRRVAEFYLRNREPHLAEPQLKRLIDGTVKADESDLLWARRSLATICFTRGGYENHQRALELVQQNLAVISSSLQDQRLYVMIAAADPQQQRRGEAVQMLEKLTQDPGDASPEDQLMLAQLYLAQGAWARASAQMRRLLSAHGDKARYVGEYVDMLLDHKEVPEAERWLERLEALAPNDFSTIDLRSRWLVERRRYVEALDLVQGFMERTNAQPADRTTRLRMVANVLETMGRRLQGEAQPAMAARCIREAEMLFRQYVDQRPEDKLALAAFLGRQGRIDDALEVFEQNWSRSNAAAVAQLGMALLRPSTATPEQVRRGEKILRTALEKFRRPAVLQLTMADLKVAQGRYQEAEAAYREILKEHGEHPVAMNNLAVLLAMQKTKLEESLDLVNKAIQRSGPLASMLDSRASVYIALGQADKAIADVQEAIADSATPVRLFHLAQAYALTGKNFDAAETITKANKAGLKPDMLQPPELPEYEKLQSLLKAPSSQR